MKSKVIFEFQEYLTQIEEIVGEELKQEQVEEIVKIQKNVPSLKKETIDYMISIGYKYDETVISSHTYDMEKFYEYFYKE
jgi:hypothetical protein